MRKKLLKHRTGPGPNDYVKIRAAGIEPCRFLTKLKEVFPNELFLDPHGRHGVQNLIYVAAGAAGTPRVYVRRYDKEGKFRGVDHVVRLVRTGNLRADVITWVRCLWEVYDDLDLPLPFAEVEHAVHCLTAGHKLTAAEAKHAVRLVQTLYADHERG